uniref:Survival of motor neuron-related-splicing factor 30 n=1 Tax=Heterorhabditis bacteriophora TaxID=37862 RepID=A0A1I7WUI9_HETBA
MMADDELASYKLQLQQVEAALLGDPDNEELHKLKADLEEVINLQEELSSASAAVNSVPDASASSSVVPNKEWNVGDRVMGPLPNGNRAVAIVDSLTAAGAAITFINSGQKTIVDPTDLGQAPDGGKKNYIFDSTHKGNKKEWHVRQPEFFWAERERRRLRAQKKDMKKKELEAAKEGEKNNWLKFNSKAMNKGMKGMKRVIATGSAQDGPASGFKSQATISSRSNQFAFKSARGSMDSLF